MISTMSMRQALLVWSELEQAFYGDNSYGGDVAEIYAYTLLEDCPSAHATSHGGKRITDGMFGDAIRDQAIAAAENLHALLMMFRDKRPCRIFVEGQPLSASFLEPIDHRVHVHVLRGEEAGDEDR